MIRPQIKTFLFGYLGKSPGSPVIFLIMSLFKTPVYRDNYVYQNDGLIDCMLDEYNRLRFREEDKQQELFRNRRIVEQTIKPESMNPGPRFPELNKQDELIF